MERPPVTAVYDANILIEATHPDAFLVSSICSRGSLHWSVVRSNDVDVREPPESAEDRRGVTDDR